MTQNKTDFDELMTNLVKRLTSREFLVILLLLTTYIPILVPKLPPNLQDLALGFGTIVSVAFAIIRTFGKIKESEINETKKLLEDLDKNYQETKNFKA